MDIKKAKEFADSKNVKKIYSSPLEISSDPDIDIITICTPSGTHLETALSALENGKHILVEKPLEITTERIDKIIKYAKEHNLKLGAVFQLRFSPDIQKAKKALENNLLGKIHIADAYIKYYRTPEYYNSSGWRGTWEFDGGGALMNQSIHYIDLLSYLAGPVDSVMGSCHTLSRNIEVEDTAHALVTYKNGAVGVIEGTTLTYPGLPPRIEIHGEKGSICLEGDKIVKWEIEGESSIIEKTESKEKGYADPKAIDARGHIIQIQDMVDAVLNDRSPIIDGLEARHSVAIIESIYNSSKSNNLCKIK